MQRNPILFKICKFAKTSTKSTVFSFLLWFIEKCCFCSFSHFRDCLEGCRFSWSVSLVFMILDFHILRYSVWLLYYLRHGEILQLRNKTVFIQLRFLHSLWFGFKMFLFFLFPQHEFRFLFSFLRLWFFFLFLFFIFNNNLTLTEFSFLLLLQLL